MPRRFHVYAVYGLLLLGAFAIAASKPLLFQKLNTLRPAEGVPDLDTTHGFLDVEAVIRPIPLHGRQVWNVSPAIRHRRTMIEGGGNCSQVSFGLAYQLEGAGIDYQIIHMFTPKGLGLGDGHTVIRVPYRHQGEERVGLVDLSFGSILTGDVGPLDVADLEDPPVEGWGHIPLNDAARFPNYHDDFLVDAVVGYVPPGEVRRYYAFIDRVYFSVGAEMAEKYFFDGLALLFGYLPEVYVLEYDHLLGHRRKTVALHRGALAVMRSAVVVLPLLVGFELLQRRRRPGARRAR